MKSISRILILAAILNVMFVCFIFANTINIPGDYSTIQEGIDASVNGDTVLVHPGTYSNDINFNGKSIMVASLFLTTQDTAYISGTIISGHDMTYYKVVFNSAEDSTSVLSGFTIKDKSGKKSHGIQCDASSPTITNNTIYDNHYVGIFCSSSSPIITNNTISSSNYGGGIVCESSSFPFIGNNTISDNFRSGISCSESSPTISNNVIKNNDPYNHSFPGIICVSSSSPIIINNEILNNSWYGIDCGSNCSPVISNNIISDNSCSGIKCDGSPMISNNTINNSSNGIDCGSSCSPTIRYNLISDNNRGINCSSDDAAPIVYNNTICHSYIGIDCGNYSAAPSIINNIFYNIDIGVYVNYAPSFLEYNLFYLINNFAGWGSGIPASFGSITTINVNGDSCDVYNNLFMDPRFINPDSLNFHLAEISPCIDAGNPDPVYNDPDGSIADIGALHFDPALVPLTVAFSASPVVGNTPLGVQFTDLSFGFPTAWEWDFQNDGTIDSYEQNPIFTYNDGGNYTVSLTVINGSGQVTELKEDYITVFVDHVDPLIADNWRSHTWPYNAYYPLCDDPSHRHGVANGRVACSCGPTTFSRILHYWKFPVQGNGYFSFTDCYGCTYAADFGSTIYEWDKMPYALNTTDPEEVYGAAATLTYHVATCVNDVNVTGASFEMWFTGLTSYLRYSTLVQKAERANYTRDEWINLYKIELVNGRPIVVAGGNPDGGAHWFICDGFNESDEFHFIMGWGGNGDGYYDIDNPNGYSLNNSIVIGLQPELNGKEITLTAPDGGETLNGGETVNITWTSKNVLNIKIELSTDNGYNWQEITASIPAGTGSYSWLVPYVNSDQCKVKLSDTDDINIYDKSDDVFSIPSGLTLVSPNGGNCYIQGSLTSITWGNTTVSNINIEYSINNGSDWTSITAGTPASSGTYDWIIPNIISDQCKVKITDITNETIYDESDDVFSIIAENIIGGPYAVDDNTILLLHFENNLTNSSSLSEDGVSHGSGVSYGSDTPSNLEQCLKLNNSDGSFQSYITIPHNDNLSLTGDWTIEAWINISSMGAVHTYYPCILTKPGNTDPDKPNYTILEVASNSWPHVVRCFYYSANSNSSPLVYSPADLVEIGNWYHIAFIRNTGDRSIKCLIHNADRELISEKTSWYSQNEDLPAINAQDLFIGKSMNQSWTTFDGYIDEVRISNVVRDFTPVGIDEEHLKLRIESFVLHQNYPNPFNPTTKINYDLPKNGHVNITVFDIQGKMIHTLVDGHRTAGSHSVNFNANGLASGLYYYRLQTSQGFVQTKKLVLLR